MLQWLARGLRLGQITTRYPAREEPPPPGYHGSVRVLEPLNAPAGLAALCPTAAITVSDTGQVRLDRGRCILCGDCVRADPARFAFEARYQTATNTRPALVAGADEYDPEPLRRALGDRARMLRRSIHVRHIDCGSDGSEEWEIQALWNPYYDIQRLGFFLTAAPRHADILLVTGAVTAPMRAPLERTWLVMPEPKALIAVGSEACSGALTSGLTAGGIDALLPVDVYVPGSPPAPIAIMHGLLLATGVLRATAQETA